MAYFTEDFKEEDEKEKLKEGQQIVASLQVVMLRLRVLKRMLLLKNLLK